MLLEDTHKGWKPVTEQDKAAVWSQVERLIGDPSLSRSKRYQSLLRYVVTHALDGDIDSLKERIVGIEVFERRPDYDSALDPIVRVNAAELRKRIIRYYQDPLHQDELRLFLPVGSYVPRFELPGDDAPPGTDRASDEVEAGLPTFRTAVVTVARYFQAQPQKRILVAVLICLSFGLLLLGVARLYPHSHRQGALERFWAPFSESSRPILICIADQSKNGAALIDASDPVQLIPEKNEPSIMSSATLSPVVDITGHLAATGHVFRVQAQAQTTYSEIAAGPTILVGAFNNFWTLKLTRSLPLHFNNDSAFQQLWIERAKSPGVSSWKMETGTHDPGEEYALVSRYFDTYTRQWVIVIAGLGQKSNIGALRFVLSNEGLAELDRRGLGDWSHKNIEIVLSTHVVNGNAAPSMIESVDIW